jgi:asparagine synthase (glutamine-hydrolysing)
VPKYDISSLDLGKTRFGDETSFIKATADYSGNIDVELLSAQNISILDGIYKQLEVQNEPAHAAGNCYWMTEILQKAKEKDFGTLLTGQGGNATISWKGQQKTGSISEVYAQLKKGELTVQMTMKHLIKTALPFIVDLRLFLKGLNSPWNSYSAINLNYAKEIGLKKLMKKSGHDPLFKKKKNPLDSRLNLIKPGRNHIGSLWQNNGSNFGIEVRDPTIDKQLMEFCLSIPDTYYRTKEYDRFFIRQALKGYLPEDVLWNKKRGLQSADMYFRAKENKKEILQILTDLEKIKQLSRFLDIPKMKSIIQNLNEGKSFYSQVKSISLRGIGAGIFLKQFYEDF